MRIGLAHPGTPALPGAEFARIFLNKRRQKIALIICDEQITGFLDIFRNFFNELPLFASKREVVLQKRGRKEIEREQPLQFFLSNQSKQFGDQRDLPFDISFCHSPHLSFPHHVHDLIPL
jgi:hypothetical protein